MGSDQALNRAPQDFRGLTLVAVPDIQVRKFDGQPAGNSTADLALDDGVNGFNAHSSSFHSQSVAANTKPTKIMTTVAFSRSLRVSQKAKSSPIHMPVAVAPNVAAAPSRIVVITIQGVIHGEHT